MKNVIETRFLHLKKHWFSLLFWLIMPLAATLTFILVLDAVQDDSKVPIGIVIENKSGATTELFNEISNTPFIKAQQLTEEVALYQLRKHELDSVFIIGSDFASQIRQGNRSQIITSYQTDQSLAYTPVKEMILSYVQQETGRSKTAYIIRELVKSYKSESEWTYDQIISKSKEIQEEENLLQTSFSYSHVNSQPAKELSIWDVWAIWSICSMLATLLIFDWVVKENHSTVKSRFAFTRISFKGYLVRSFSFYAILFILMDSISLLILYFLQYVQFNLSVIAGLISYRFILLLGAFLLALLFRNLFQYYVVSFAITLLTIISSGAIIPINGLLSRWPWLAAINPLHPILSDGNIVNVWPLLLIIIFAIWYSRKEHYYA